LVIIILVGLSGEVRINSIGDREVDYTLNDLDPVTGVMTPVGSFYGEDEQYLILPGKIIHWPNNSKSAPPDVPLCGFTGDALHCVVKGKFNYRYIYTQVYYLGITNFFI